MLDPSGSLGTPLGAVIPSTVHVDEQAVLLREGRVLIIADDGHAGVYDPAGETFTPTGSISGPRVGGRAALLADGRVMVVGGTRAYGDDAATSADVFDPATGTFHLAGPLGTARFFPTVTVLADGRVLIEGGTLAPADRGDPAPVEAEIVDPRAIP